MLQTPISELTAKLQAMFDRSSLSNQVLLGDPSQTPAKEDDENKPAPSIDDLAKQLTSAIGAWEWRDSKDPSTYQRVNSIGAMGRYQFMPDTLSDASKKYFGRKVPPSEFLSNPALQDQLAFLMTKEHLRSNIEYANGDVKTALRMTAFDHYGWNGAKDRNPSNPLLGHSAHHNGKVVGESPNDYANNVLRRMSGVLPKIIQTNRQPVTAPVSNDEAFPETIAEFPGGEGQQVIPNQQENDLGYSDRIPNQLQEQTRSARLTAASQAIEQKNAQEEYDQQHAFENSLKFYQNELGITPPGIESPERATIKEADIKPGESLDEARDRHTVETMENMSPDPVTRFMLNVLPPTATVAAVRAGSQLVDPIISVDQAIHKALGKGDSRAYLEKKKLAPLLNSSSRVLNTLADISAGAMKAVATVETGAALGLGAGASFALGTATEEGLDYASGNQELTPGNLLKSIGKVAVADLTGEAFPMTAKAGEEIGGMISQAAASAKVPVVSNPNLLTSLGRMGGAMVTGDAQTQANAALDGRFASNDERLAGALSLVPFEVAGLRGNLKEAQGTLETGGETSPQTSEEAKPVITSSDVHSPYSPGRYVTEEPTVPHLIENGPNKGKAVNGIVARDLSSLSEARAIDPYAFKKDDGYFIHEKHVSRPEGYDEAQLNPANIIAEVEAKRGSDPAQANIEEDAAQPMAPEEFQGTPGDTNTGATRVLNDTPDRVIAAPDGKQKEIPKDRPDFSMFDDEKFGPQTGPGLKDLSEMKTGELKDYAASKLKKSLVGRAIDKWQKKLAPQTISDGAMTAALDIRAIEGKRMRQSKIADEALKESHQYMAQMTRSQTAEFMYDADYGFKSENPKLQQMRKLFDSLFADARDRLHAVAPEALKTWYENYFPHYWKDPEQARSVFSDPARQQSLMGDKSFMKQRYYSDIYEGLKAGLEPISWNPADMVRMKLGSINRFIAGEEIKNSFFNRSGVTVFVPNRGDAKAPDGYTLDKNDPNFMVRGTEGPVEIREAYDRGLSDDLDAFLKTVEPTLDPKRVVNLKLNGKQVGGYVRSFGPRGDKTNVDMKTLFGSTEGVRVHEIGHIIDNKFNLYDKVIGKDPELLKQARDLAMERVRSSNGNVSGEQLKYLRKPEELIANLAHAYVIAPDLLKSVAPDLGNAFDRTLQTIPELSTFRNLRPSLDIDYNTAEAGRKIPVVRGWYAVRNGEYQVLKNYLSPGLAGRSVIYDALRAYNNTASMAKLSLSAFHGLETSYNSVVNDLGRGMRLGFQGRDKEAAEALANSLRLVKKYKSGKQFLRAYNSPGSEGEYLDMLVNRAIMGGFQGGKDSYYDSRMRQMFREAIGNNIAGTKETLSGTADALTSGKLLNPKTAAKGVMALLEQVAAPIMDHFVPAMKAASVKELILDDLRNSEKQVTDESEIKRMIVKHVDHVDNIFGQVIYSNLFWDKAAKDKLLQTFLSTGWNFGTGRAAVGSVVDLVRSAHNLWEGENFDMSQRTAYMASLIVSHAFLSSLITGLLAHRAPNSLMDLILPASGDKDDLGNDRRLSVKDYFTDLYALRKDPEGTIIGKLAPVFSTVATLIRNKGHWGNQVYNPDDPVWQQWMDRGLFVASDFIPFTISGIRNEIKEGTNNKGLVEFGSLLGIKPARRELYQTKAEALQERYTTERYPEGGRTSEQQEPSQSKRDLLRLLRNGKYDEAKSLRDRYVKEGKITAKDWKTVVTESKGSGFLHDFKQNSPTQAMNVVEAADDQERAILLPALKDKVRRLSTTNTPKASLEEIRTRFKTLTKNSACSAMGATRVME